MTIAQWLARISCSQKYLFLYVFPKFPRVKCTSHPWHIHTIEIPLLAQNRGVDYGTRDDVANAVKLNTIKNTIISILSVVGVRLQQLPSTIFVVSTTFLWNIICWYFHCKIYLWNRRASVFFFLPFTLLNSNACTCSDIFMNVCENGSFRVCTPPNPTQPLHRLTR